MNISGSIFLKLCMIFKIQNMLQVERNNLSMDNYGQMLGGGSCDECQHHTTGINCHECEDKYYRPEGVLPNATEPCIGNCSHIGV